MISLFQVMKCFQESDIKILILLFAVFLFILFLILSLLLLNLPAEWETRAICEIMTAGIANGEIKGWIAHKTAKRYPKYGVQKGWERVTTAKVDADGFVELTDKEAQQMGFPF